MSLKKIIIYVGGFELPDKNAAAQRVLANSKIFRDLGYKVILLGMSKDFSSQQSVENQGTVQGFETYAMPYPKSKKMWLKQIVNIDYIEKVIDEYSSNNIYAVVCYNYPAVAQMRIRRLCSKIQAYYIPDTTEWYDSTGGGIIFNIVKWLDTSLRMHVVQPFADGIITTSQYLTDFYSRKKCIIVELPTLYDVKEIGGHVKVTDQNHIRFSYAGSAFNIARVNKDRSNIKDRLDKVINMFYEASKTNDSFVLDIYGLSKDNYLSVFPEHSDILKVLSGKIWFHGRKNHAEIIEKIKKSHFTVFLRDIDRVVEAGFPSKFSESVSCGTPVLCNMISNIEKYVCQGKNAMIVSNSDVENQAKVLLEILAMGKEDIMKMKLHCAQSELFDFRAFQQPVEVFFKAVEQGRTNEGF